MRMLFICYARSMNVPSTCTSDAIRELCTRCAHAMGELCILYSSLPVPCTCDARDVHLP